jgi:hypothetical protein
MGLDPNSTCAVLAAKIESCYPAISRDSLLIRRQNEWFDLPFSRLNFGLASLISIGIPIEKPK